MLKRDLLKAGMLAVAGGVAAGGIASAQAPARSVGAGGGVEMPGLRSDVKRRVARTKPLFKAPPGTLPNALAVAPEGLWIGEQKLIGAQAKSYNMPEPKDIVERAYLVDWTGKVKHTIATESRNTSGMAYGDGYVWMIANAPPQGVFQTDMNSKTISHRQIPLGDPANGGGSHGGHWQDGKLWIVANRLRGILRVDPKTWTPEFMIPITVPRWHDITWDNGTIWLLTGNQSKNFKEGRAGLVRYSATTGEVLEIAEFAEGASDPHGLAMYNGRLISCDAGIHPGWPNYDSPTAGWIFEITIE
jgi:hypothetical protein